MKIVIALDSFKGCLSAREACDAVATGIRSVRPDIVTVSLPMADGGEGTAAAVLAARGGEWIPLHVTGPLPARRVKAGYAWLGRDATAVVEMAAASGLPLLKPEERNPLETTTFGTGELMKAALEKGAQKILLTVGGSATVDGGIGAAAALGWTFLDAAGCAVPLSGKGLSRIEKIISPPDPVPAEVEVLCDVTNPLCGPNGAARVYGPQKGATPEMVEALDAGLAQLASRVLAQTGFEMAGLKGAGAAGGLAAGAAAFMNGRLVSGIEAVTEATGLAGELAGADWVLTGEGRLDSQSLQGKVVDGVARLAKAAGVRTGVFAGRVELSGQEWRAAGIDRVAAISPETWSPEESMRRAAERLSECAAAFARGL